MSNEDDKCDPTKPCPTCGRSVLDIDPAREALMVEALRLIFDYAKAGVEKMTSEQIAAAYVRGKEWANRGYGAALDLCPRCGLMRWACKCEKKEGP